ncbi:hypothetical protein WJX72_003391 [[Myrmecia] bisecta]|uniref:WAC domain-containing protein n=1 Tax=[Myrmecia] bisecta TaxID=41462 RepID=A0AAW1Q7F5_9CHLO
MPLLNSRLWQPQSLLPADVKPNEELWVVQHTGEAFREYDEYLDRLDLCRSRVWGSVLGEEELTYEEAKLADEKARSLLEKFPPQLEETCARLVHHSTLPIEETVNQLLTAVRSSSAADGKENEHIAGKPTASASVLRVWIYEVANLEEHGSRDLWVAKPHLVDKYSLPTQLPDDLRYAIAVANGAELPADLIDIDPAKKPKRRKSKKPARIDDAEFTDGAEAAGEEPDAASGQEAAENGYDDGAETPTYAPVRMRSLEEEEARFRPGTNKYVAFHLLKEVGEAGMTVPQIMAASKAKGLKDYDEGHKRIIQFALATDECFYRVAKGVYALRAMCPDAPPPKPQLVSASRAAKKQKVAGQFAQAYLEQERNREAAVGDEGPGPSGAGEDGEATRPGSARSLEAMDEEQEQDAIVRAEQIVQRTNQLVEEQRAKYEQAAQFAAQLKAEAKEAEIKAKSPAKKKREEEEAAMPVFEVPAEVREYRGEPSDRKAIVAHKKMVAGLEEEMESKRQAWLKRIRATEVKERSVAMKDVYGLNRQLRQAHEEAEQARQAFEFAERAAADAAKALSRAKARKNKRREGDGAKSTQLEERERRRLEAAAARRYPIDDLELLRELRYKAQQSGALPPSDTLPTPEWLTPEQSEHLATLLSVADFINQFAKTIGMRPVSVAELEAMLSGSPMPAESKSARDKDKEEDAREVLYEVYQALLGFVLQGCAGKLERRWAALLGPGTWPEVLRRYVLLRTGPDIPLKLVDARVSRAAGLMGVEPVEDLTGEQHLALLHYLCDESLDTETMRAVLAWRDQGAADMQKDMREGIAEERRKLKELLEAEKEERRAKREEEARRREEEARRKAEGELRAASASREGSAQPDQQPDDVGALKQPADRSRAGSEAGDDMEEDEPSWELPEELREFSGSPSDRKGMLAFRQAQQSERQRLEAARGRWQAEQRKRQKAREAERRAQQKQEEAKYREKADAEDQIVKRQEAYEKEVEKFLVRRAPLGLDRHHRKYWWGMAGYRALVYVEDEAGLWGSWSQPGEVEAVMAVLDKRGIRESALLDALGKSFSAIATGMKRAAAAAAQEQVAAEQQGSEDEPAKAEAPVVRQSKRERGQASFYDPSKEQARPQLASSKSGSITLDLTQTLSSVDHAALEAAVGALTALQADMAAGNVPPPEDGWKAWLAAVKNASKGSLPEPGKTGQSSVTQRLIDFLRTKLLGVEEMLFVASGQSDVTDAEPLEENDNADGSEGGSAEEEDREGGANGTEKEFGADDVLEVVAPTPDKAELAANPPSVRPLWRTLRERSLWKQDLAQAVTMPRVAYCATVLPATAAELLKYLGDLAAGRKPSRRRDRDRDGPSKRRR